MSRSVPLLLALLLTSGLGGCGGAGEETPTAPTATSSPSSPSSSPSSSSPDSDPESVRITVTREGDDVTPNGARVEVGVGEPVAITITSDRPGELHIHTLPERQIAYAAGTSEHEIVIDRPGVVEVESHEPALIVLQLEVR